ncbi:uncharacterized protein BCR38DRAFT_424023 [Pseudomassariella vexata]|uniref:Uncharacterized protein n=1 Tax=Pseudomassariella vexata TaxID=1141098 RepID=A0A1Y2EBP0_9PEZI|nr:uncharacterized protein BCR38DRAFT_424023 [Pseudomassariella vexata]ORY68686.1 hypothetical protein BCR38DRAFT_424023 [Pseudomassariella vexata]
MRCLFSHKCTMSNSPDNAGIWVMRHVSERFRQDLVDTHSYGKSWVSIVVWSMT